MEEDEEEGAEGDLGIHHKEVSESDIILSQGHAFLEDEKLDTDLAQ